MHDVLNRRSVDIHPLQPTETATPPLTGSCKHHNIYENHYRFAVWNVAFSLGNTKTTSFLFRSLLQEKHYVSFNEVLKTREMISTSDDWNLK